MPIAHVHETWMNVANNTQVQITFEKEETWKEEMTMLMSVFFGGVSIYPFLLCVRIVLCRVEIFIFIDCFSTYEHYMYIYMQVYTYAIHITCICVEKKRREPEGQAQKKGDEMQPSLHFLLPSSKK